jgi:hypothetical protein
MGTATGFHAHEYRRQRRDKVQQLTTGHTLPEHHVSDVIHPDDVKDELGDIDAEYGDCLAMGLASSG